ncbi:MAG: neutral zinc metallopeptidase [Bacteroidales bacterium]|nr:neutral zinc metallopeptidase [Bacteroidales bacterium]
MKLEGRRQSSNVDDRRLSSSGKAAGGLGILGVIVYFAISLFSGKGVDLSALQSVLGDGISVQSEREITPEEEELAVVAKQILASTEEIWTAYFSANGLGEYPKPTMVLYTGSTRSGCGQGSAAMGPFYCSADQCLYIDLSFFSTMKKQLGADEKPFNYAYVIAHEVGHHVQNVLGTLGSAHQQMAKMSKAQANEVSVMIELQADFYAGVWANKENNKYRSLEDGDIESAIRCAQVIGDDYLQKKAQGYVVEESFTHGTSAQRARWFKKGLQTGDIRQGNTFSYKYSEL